MIPAIIGLAIIFAAAAAALTVYAALVQGKRADVAQGDE
jgi:hypothetical protein